MKIMLVANPRSGGRNNDNSIQEIRQRFEKAGIRVELCMTTGPGDSGLAFEQMDVRQVDGVVSAGGDGTNYQVLNELLTHLNHDDIPSLGVIPLGRGNSFARDLGVFSVEEGIAAVCRQQPRYVDVCRFTQGGSVGYFVNCLGVGFVTDVAKTAARVGWAGDVSYVIGVFYHTFGLAFHRMTLEIDGSSFSEENCFVEFCNSRYTGGDMLMAPDARIDDGHFDVVVTAPLSRVGLIATLPALFKGAHGRNPAVRFMRGTSAKLKTTPSKTLLPDGEIFGSTPVEIQILPRRVRYYTG